MLLTRVNKTMRNQNLILSIAVVFFVQVVFLEGFLISRHPFPRSFERDESLFLVKKKQSSPKDDKKPNQTPFFFADYDDNVNSVNSTQLATGAAVGGTLAAARTATSAATIGGAIATGSSTATTTTTATVVATSASASGGSTVATSAAGTLAAARTATTAASVAGGTVVGAVSTTTATGSGIASSGAGTSVGASATAAVRAATTAASVSGTGIVSTAGARIGTSSVATVAATTTASSTTRNMLIGGSSGAASKIVARVGATTAAAGTSFEVAGDGVGLTSIGSDIAASTGNVAAGSEILDTVAAVGTDAVDTIAGAADGVLSGVGDVVAGATIDTAMTVATGAAVWSFLPKWLVSGGLVAIVAEVSFALFALYVAVQSGGKDEYNGSQGVEIMNMDEDTETGSHSFVDGRTDAVTQTTVKDDDADFDTDDRS